MRGGKDGGGPRRVTLALTAAGFSTFAVLYCVQPLLPVFTAKFRVSPAAYLSEEMHAKAIGLAMGLVLGTAGGWFWARQGWAGVAGFVTSLFVVALLVAIRLAGLPPLQPEANSPPLAQ